MIETLTGVPSIIFGLMGLAVFVPITIKYTPANSANILSGSLTLAVILLPVIIRSTEESLKVVPDSFRRASLALGANNTQTTFKVVLPSALPGILTATLLAIGRVIGESAALIFAIGTAIKDEISIFGKSTTLAVHIWALMTDEPANIELACAISIIIPLIVLILNLSIKLISKTYLKKFEGRNLNDTRNIQIQNLDLFYDKFQLLSNINTIIEHKKVTALIGRPVVENRLS